MSISPCTWIGVFFLSLFLFLNDTASTQIYTLSLHDALPISDARGRDPPQLLARGDRRREGDRGGARRSEEHTSELQSLRHLVCRLLLEKKNTASRPGTLERRGERSTGQDDTVGEPRATRDRG